MGLTVVGNPAATAITSSPACCARSPRLGDVSAEKLELYLKVLYVLLRDLLLLREGRGDIRNPDIRLQLAPLAQKVSFAWIAAAVKQVDDLVELLRRNIQKTIALGPNLLQAYYELGRAHWFAGEQDTAKEAWDQGFKANKFNPWGKKCKEMLDTVSAGGEPPR